MNNTKVYLNKYCWCGTIGKFMDTDLESWMRTMEKNYKNVSPFELPEQQKRAWRNSYRVLQESLGEMDCSYRRLHLIFEYCLPKYPLRADQEPSPVYVVRPDCVIVSQDTLVVLEFKDREDIRVEHAREARKYRNRLNKYHDQSRGFRKWAILVPTLAQGISEKVIQRTTACSPDQLSNELKAQLGSSPRPLRSMKQWRESSYSAK